MYTSVMPIMWLSHRGKETNNKKKELCNKNVFQIICCSGVCILRLCRSDPNVNNEMLKIIRK